MFTKNDIARHYELCEEHYRNWWNLSESRSMHYGYWDHSTKSLHEALMNINKVMSDKVQINPNDHVLDAGCGLGGSSLWLAGNIGCRVTGITLSNKQKEKAERSATQMRLNDRVDFKQEDFTDTHFTDGSFDVIWAIESVCHAEDKFKFLTEAYRLLKPGGRLIVADFFSKSDLTGKDKDLMDKMAYGWAISAFATMENFKDQTTKAGFTNIITEDASKPITPSAKKLYWYSFPGMFLTKLYSLFKNPSELSKYNARTIYLQYKGLQKGLWKYYILQAEKK